MDLSFKAEILLTEEEMEAFQFMVEHLMTKISLEHIRVLAFYQWRIVGETQILVNSS